MTISIPLPRVIRDKGIQLLILRDEVEYYQLTTATCASRSRTHHDPSVPTRGVGPDADIIYIFRVPWVLAMSSLAQLAQSLGALADLR